MCEEHEAEIAALRAALESLTRAFSELSQELEKAKVEAVETVQRALSDYEYKRSLTIEGETKEWMQKAIEMTRQRNALADELARYKAQGGEPK